MPLGLVEAPQEPELEQMGSLHSELALQVLQATPPLPQLLMALPVLHPPDEVMHPLQQVPLAHLPPLQVDPIGLTIWVHLPVEAHLGLMQGLEVVQVEQVTPPLPHEVDDVPVRQLLPFTQPVQHTELRHLP